MVKYLIATHGTLADGYKSSVGVLMGQEIADHIMTINSFVEGGTKDPKTAIETACNSVGNDDQLIVFTDLMYGSVNQLMFPFAERHNIFIITGINLPLLCEVISKMSFVPDAQANESDILELIEKSKNEIKYVKNEISNSSDDQQGFFD